MKRTLVIGDIHGGYKALLQVLERGNVTPEDKLIFLGDYVDGWSETCQVIEKLIELSKSNECIFIKGNHDEWFRHWIFSGQHPVNWLQGGYTTALSYMNKVGNRSIQQKMKGWVTNLTRTDIPLDHIKFFESLHNYYYDFNTGQVFVHGGYRSEKGIGNDPEQEYYWDRELWSIALSGHNSSKKGPNSNLPRRLRPHKEIFIGHTSTINWEDKAGNPIITPMNACNVWNLDTGCGFGGKLTIMDVNTKEYWQSDRVDELYINEKGR